ncbi:MAG: glycosyltransferase [Patescibacteria group bacterium]
MFLSLSITTYNRKRLTECCINSIIKTTPRDEYEFIVVDNKSTDDTVEMLKEMKNSGIIDKLILNPKNYHIGKSKNQAWDIAHKDAEYLLISNNDFFFMDGWFENLKKVITSPKIDFVNTIFLEGISTNKVACGIPRETKNGGKYMIPVLKPGKLFDVIGSPCISKKLVLKYNIRFSEKPFTSGYTGPAPIFYKQLYNLKLNGVRLNKPAILLQDPGYNDPDFQEYYNETFGSRGLLNLLNFYKKHGHVKNPQEYYSETDYLERKNK